MSSCFTTVICSVVSLDERNALVLAPSQTGPWPMPEKLKKAKKKVKKAKTAAKKAAETKAKAKPKK